MSVSIPLPATPFSTIFSGARRFDAATLTARYGADAVRLRPSWAALIAATRFARRTRWLFGNRAATLECVDPRPKRWLTQREAGDSVQMHLDLDRWGTAYARSEGHTREIHVFAGDGNPIAAVRLDDAEASLDELIWLLVDDEQHPVVVPRRPTELVRPFAPGALHTALLAAFDAQLPLQFMLANAGGAVSWLPVAPAVVDRIGWVELRSGAVRLMLDDRAAGVWTVRPLSRTHEEHAIDVRGADNAPWLQIALHEASTMQRFTWHRICRTLAHRGPHRSE